MRERTRTPEHAAPATGKHTGGPINTPFSHPSTLHVADPTTSLVGGKAVRLCAALHALQARAHLRPIALHPPAPSRPSRIRTSHVAGRPHARCSGRCLLSGRHRCRRWPETRHTWRPCPAGGARGEEGGGTYASGRGRGRAGVARWQRARGRQGGATQCASGPAQTWARVRWALLQAPQAGGQPHGKGQ